MKRVSRLVGLGLGAVALCFAGCGGGGGDDEAPVSPFTGVWMLSMYSDTWGPIVWCLHEGRLFGVDYLGAVFEGQVNGGVAEVKKYRKSDTDRQDAEYGFRVSVQGDTLSGTALIFPDVPGGEAVPVTFSPVYDGEEKGMTGIYQVQFTDGSQDIAAFVEKNFLQGVTYGGSVVEEYTTPTTTIITMCGLAHGRVCRTIDRRGGAPLRLGTRKRPSSGGGGGGGGTSSAWAGTIRGQWWGNCSQYGNVGGNFTMTIAASGSVNITVTGSQSGTVGGSVDPNGSLSTSGSGSGSGVSWSGTFNRQGACSGGWSDPGLRCSGGWSGTYQ